VIQTDTQETNAHKIFIHLQLTSISTVFQSLDDGKLFTNRVVQTNYIPCWWSQNVVCQVLLENLSDLDLTPTQIAGQNSAHEFLCGYSSLGVSEMCQGVMTPHHLHTRSLLLYQYAVCNHLESAHSLQRIPHSAEKKTPLSRGNASGVPNFPNVSFSFKNNCQVLQLEDRKKLIIIAICLLQQLHGLRHILSERSNFETADFNSN